jgi:hypothetical protein
MRDDDSHFKFPASPPPNPIQIPNVRYFLTKLTWFPSEYSGMLQWYLAQKRAVSREECFFSL